MEKFRIIHRRRQIIKITSGEKSFGEEFHVSASEALGTDGKTLESNSNSK